MTAPLDDLEQRLLQAHRNQLDAYERALALAAQSEPATGWVQELNAILSDITHANRLLADDKAAWHASGRTPGRELGQVLARLAELIRALGECVNRHIVDVEARKQRMLPEIDEFVQQRRMLQAYASRR